MNFFRTLLVSFSGLNMKHATVVAGLLLFALNWAHAAGGGASHAEGPEFPLSETTYMAMEEAHMAETGEELGLIERLKLRASANPFNIVATVIFLLAVCHTFLATTFNKLAHKYEVEHRNAVSSHNKLYVEGKEPVSFKATLFHFLGEIEAIFGIWLIPLLLTLVFVEPEGFHVAAAYVDGRNFTEPMFVVIIMAIASSRPVIQFAETLPALGRLNR